MGKEKANTSYRQGDTAIKQVELLLCPICRNKTRIKIREDTELKNFHLYDALTPIETAAKR